MVTPTIIICEIKSQ